MWKEAISQWEGKRISDNVNKDGRLDWSILMKLRFLQDCTKPTIFNYILYGIESSEPFLYINEYLP